MADFDAWQHESLVAFAKETQARLVEQDVTIALLQQDVKMLLDRVRELMKDAAK